ncbi:MAG: hypothetical protein UMR38_07420 [Candidatus Izemoplasma sp.]|nr:hypothetical protein [Candidatus Izemoplasma sp.]
MKTKRILDKIESGDLTAEEAFEKMYPVTKVKPGKRATFIKIDVRVPDESKGVNTFLKILFAIPIPMIFARMGLRLGKRFAKLDNDEIDFDQLSHLIKYSKNTKIQVDSNDAQVDIRII